MQKRVIVSLIRCYQKVLSPDQGFLQKLLSLQGNYCTMYPSCSEYTIGAVEKYGVCVGLFRGGRRVLRCHPYQKQLVDFP